MTGGSGVSLQLSLHNGESNVRTEINVRPLALFLFLVAATTMIACGGGGDEPASGTTSNVPNTPEKPDPSTDADTKTAAQKDTSSSDQPNSAEAILARLEKTYKEMICLTQKGEVQKAKKVYKAHGFKSRAEFDRKWSHYAKADKKWSSGVATSAVAKGACK